MAMLSMAQAFNMQAKAVDMELLAQSSEVTETLMAFTIQFTHTRTQLLRPVMLRRLKVHLSHAFLNVQSPMSHAHAQSVVDFKLPSKTQTNLFVPLSTYQVCVLATRVGSRHSSHSRSCTVCRSPFTNSFCTPGVQRRWSTVDPLRQQLPRRTRSSVVPVPL